MRQYPGQYFMTPLTFFDGERYHCSAKYAFNGTVLYSGQDGGNWAGDPFIFRWIDPTKAPTDAGVGVQLLQDQFAFDSALASQPGTGYREQCLMACGRSNMERMFTYAFDGPPDFMWCYGVNFQADPVQCQLAIGDMHLWFRRSPYVKCENAGDCSTLSRLDEFCALQEWCPNFTKMMMSYSAPGIDGRDGTEQLVGVMGGELPHRREESETDPGPYPGYPWYKSLTGYRWINTMEVRTMQVAAPVCSGVSWEIITNRSRTLCDPHHPLGLTCVYETCVTCLSDPKSNGTYESNCTADDFDMYFQQYNSYGQERYFQKTGYPRMRAGRSYDFQPVCFGNGMGDSFSWDNEFAEATPYQLNATKFGIRLADLMGIPANAGTCM